MSDVEAFCRLVGRLTPAQRSLLVRLPLWGAILFVSVPLMETGHVRGLHQMGLVVPHLQLAALFQRSALGDAVVESLLDTEVVADVG